MSASSDSQGSAMEDDEDYMEEEDEDEDYVEIQTVRHGAPSGRGRPAGRSANKRTRTPGNPTNSGSRGADNREAGCK